MEDLVSTKTLPPLSTDTSQAGHILFSPENRYIMIGNQLDELLDGLDLKALDATGEKQERMAWLLAMVTIFQYAESIPDQEAIQSLHKRLDWKYALHIPLSYSVVAPETLCGFRQHILSNSAAQTTFQALIERVSLIDLFHGHNNRPDSAVRVLQSVCNLSRMERIGMAIYNTLGALASIKPEWLLRISLPHWYERYDQILVNLYLNRSDQEREDLLVSIGTDMLYLITEIDYAHNPELSRLPEVRAMRLEWIEQFELQLGEVKWRVHSCASCTGRNCMWFTKTI
jgi:transposase